ncbi:hypothetical protein AB8A05_03965 [Tardiphaga sp. 538_B7_N1_4]|uniref:hypothetical protein n=1 Tax=Tardiphaga sp. 538_B7_N1_4 TaxID=3240778 RepID=UPI003F28A54C
MSELQGIFNSVWHSFRQSMNDVSPVEFVRHLNDHGLQLVDIRTPAPTPPEPVAEQNIRWAVNVLLETIAKKFDDNETWDIWRSDAAATVRSFKHVTPLYAVPAISTSAVDEIAHILGEIEGLTTSLRSGGPDPMDLQDLSDSLSRACELATDAGNLLSSLPTNSAEFGL